MAGDEPVMLKGWVDSIEGWRWGTGAQRLGGPDGGVGAACC